MQNRPGQQLQPSSSGWHCSPFWMQHSPSGWWHVQRSSGHVPQLPPHWSSPHARSPWHCEVHGTHVPPLHFFPPGQFGHVAGLPHESVIAPH